MRSNEGDEEQGRLRSASFNGSKEIMEEETFVEKVLINGKKIFIVLLAIEVSLLDPLFFYVPMINDRRKCGHLDLKLGTALGVLRSLIDFFYAIYITAQVRKHFFVASSRKDQDEDQYKKLGTFLFLTDFLAVLPLPQVVLLIIPTMRGSKFLNAMYLLRSVVLCQFVPRFFRTYLFITSGTFGDPAEARFKFSPFLYMLGIGVIGAFWYFMSMERLMKCYKKACENLDGCVYSFYCKDDVGDHTSLYDSCTKTKLFNFGIFEDALKSQVIEITDFPKKFLYCLQWSLQNLSGFGQNLKPSTYSWENVFAISTSIFGLLLFLFIVGSMQAYIESQRKGKEKIKLKAIDIMENWPPLENLSTKLKQQIKKYLKYHWEKNASDVGIILSNLPADLNKSLKDELCWELVKKEKLFENVDDSERDKLSESLELKLYKEGDYIEQVGEPMKAMVFIKHGKLAFIEGKPNRDEIYGKELIQDVFIHDGSSGLLDSTRTIRASTSVQALVLTADEVRYFLRDFYADHIHRVRHKHCFDLLTKVKVFKGIGKNELDKLFESVELKLFKGGEYIVQEGNAIERMVVIVKGELEAYSNREVDRKIVLKDGDICGEELTLEVIYDWSSEVFESTRTVRARTRVQALVLPANKLTYFICNLPLEHIWRMRRELFLDLLKKVDLFKNMDDYALHMLYDHVMPVSYINGDSIIKQGESIDALVLVVNGTIEVTDEKHGTKFLENGDLCGEELADWTSQPESLTKPKPVSTRNIKALTRVLAVVFEARYLVGILHRR